MLLIELGPTEYLQSLETQHKIVAGKLSQGSKDVLLLLEHPPTVTLGIRGKLSSFVICEQELAERGIAVHRVDRGGEATYHGPGQLVGYPILHLKSLGLTARSFVQALEETILTTLRHYGIDGFRQRGTAGVWIDSTHKIASIGVRIRRGVTYHGFSLNVGLDVDPTDFTVLCGMPEARMVSLGELVSVPVSVASVKEIVARSFEEVFGVTLERCTLDEALLGLP